MFNKDISEIPGCFAECITEDSTFVGNPERYVALPAQDFHERMNECTVPGINSIGKISLAPGDTFYIGDCGVTGHRRGMSYTMEIVAWNANNSGRTLTDTPTVGKIQDVGNAIARVCSKERVNNGVTGYAFGGVNRIGQTNDISYFVYSWS